MVLSYYSEKLNIISLAYIYNNSMAWHGDTHSPDSTWDLNIAVV